MAPAVLRLLVNRPSSEYAKGMRATMLTGPLCRREVRAGGALSCTVRPVTALAQACATPCYGCCLLLQPS